ncbi:MAG: hypothetical protein VX127_10760, partial [Myxococcota bacterium]|nr:hypothetical protein [Myxococcota bacterium]
DADTAAPADDTGVSGEDGADGGASSVGGPEAIEGGGELKGECGCATSRAPTQYLWLLPMIGLLIRRRYQ